MSDPPSGGPLAPGTNSRPGPTARMADLYAQPFRLIGGLQRFTEYDADKAPTPPARPTRLRSSDCAVETLCDGAGVTQILNYQTGPHMDYTIQRATAGPRTVGWVADLLEGAPRLLQLDVDACVTAPSASNA